MPPGGGSETPAGTLAGGRWLAAQPDSAATHATAAAATTPTARMLIRRTTVRPGCADFSAGTAVPLVGLARGGCGRRFGVDADRAEARGHVVDPVGRCPVVGQRDTGLGAPQRVAEGVAQMPRHDPGGRQLAAGDLLVMTHDRGQQLKAGTHVGTRKG